MIETNDDDWELFVPVKGEKYPDACQYRYRRIDHKWSEWSRGPIGVADYPRNDIYQYRKPKQKGNKVPERTPQQALKDAIDSGAVDAWINGEEVEFHRGAGDWGKDWSSSPSFTDPICFFRPKPPEPTKINWQPVVIGKEPKGWVLGVFGDIKHYVVTLNFTDAGSWFTPEGLRVDCPTHWAPMCNLPEGDK